MVLKETSRIAVSPKFLFSDLQVFEKKLQRKIEHKTGKEIREKFNTAG
jgi:hypothetical protein